MGKGPDPKADKLAAIVTWFQKSRTCWNIKDLEKQLPSAAGISGMQVKEYLQFLQDESKISVEKIGSGNWYWSFPSTDQNTKATALASAQKVHSAISTTVEELRAKVADNTANSTSTEEEDAEREELAAQKSILEADLKTLEKDLEAYSDNDPEELELKEKEIVLLREKCEKYTDDLYALEGWFKKNGMEDYVQHLRACFYADEWDSEEMDFKAV